MTKKWNHQLQSITTTTTTQWEGNKITYPLSWRMWSNVAITGGGDYDPLTHKMAMKDVDCNKWQEAMKLEMESMHWKLMDLPKGLKPVVYKWIYKKNGRCKWESRNSQDKACGKGFYPKRWVNYDDTFSTVAMLKSIRNLLSLLFIMIVKCGIRTSRKRF